MDRNRTVEAYFVERPGTVDLDFESDLAYTLTAMSAAAGTYEWETFTAMGAAAYTYAWDRNELDYELNEVGDIQRVYVENGILDAVELYLVETVLRERHLDWTERSGIYHDIVWDAWQTNLAQAQADLSGQDERIVRTVAGYMTLGDFKSVGCVQKMVALIDAGITLDPDDYDRSTQRYLYWKSDADNDGYTNLEEWQAVSPAGELEYATAYAYEATNGEPPPPPPEQSQAQAPASECEYCNDCGTKGMVSLDVLPTFYDPTGDGGTAIGFVAGGGYSPMILLGDVEQEILLGTQVLVGAKPFDSPEDEDYGYYFAGWAADGSMLDNSPYKKDYAMLQASTPIRATFGRFKLDLPVDTSVYTVHVSEEPNVMETTGSDGKPEVKGPKETKVTLSLTIHDPDYYHNGWERLSQRGPGDPRYSWTSKVTVPLYGYIQPMVSANPGNFERRTVGLASSQGGYVLGATAHGWDGVFRYSVTYCPNTPLSFNAIPHDGFEFDRWAGTNETNPHLDYVYNMLNDPDLESMTAIFKRIRQFTVDLEVKKVGQDPTGGQCPGWIAADDPKRFYLDGEEVTLTAEPNPGYQFCYWEGDVPEADILEDSFSLAMGADKKVVAVMRWANSALTIDGGGISYTSKAEEVLEGMDYVVEPLKTPSLKKVLDEIPKHVVFVFDGHVSGASTNIVINQTGAGDPPYVLKISDVTDVDTVFGYRLAQLNSCNSAKGSTGQSWKSAFNAECFIGWHDLVTNGEVKDFDSPFWQYIGEGDATNLAFFRARADYVNENPPTAPQPVLIGNTNLALCQN